MEQHVSKKPQQGLCLLLMGIVCRGWNRPHLRTSCCRLASPELQTGEARGRVMGGHDISASRNRLIEDADRTGVEHREAGSHLPIEFREATRMTHRPR